MPTVPPLTTWSAGLKLAQHMCGTRREAFYPSVAVPLASGSSERSPAAGLLVEPDVLPARCVKDAVGVYDRSLDGWPGARAPIGIEDDRAGVVLGQSALDLPQNLLAARTITLDGLRRYQLVDLLVAVMVPIEAGAPAIEQVEDRIGVGAAGLQVETDGVLLVAAPDAADPRQITCAA